MAYKKEIVEKALFMLEEDIDVKIISLELGVSTSTIYNWKKKYKKDNYSSMDAIKVSIEIKELINCNKISAAYIIASDPRFKDDFTIQSQLITILMKQKKLSEAYKLASDIRFKNYIPIQSQLITILMKQKNLSEAYKLASESRFKKYIPIQSQLITIYLKQNNISEAYKLASNPRFKNEFPIQSQLITILMRQKKLNEAYELASESRFKNYIPIQSQLITILIYQNKLNEAYELASESRFKDDFPIQSQLIGILVFQQRYDEAWKLANETRFDNYEYILNQRKQLAKILNNANSKQLDKKEMLSILLVIEKTTITNYDEILSQIEVSKVSEWQKIIYHIALNEKVNYPLNSSLKYLKSQMMIYANNESVLKIIKSLMNRLKNKPKFFDTLFYNDLLSTTVVDNIAKEKVYLNALAVTLEDKKERKK